jgi:hypothetical protein
VAISGTSFNKEFIDFLARSEAYSSKYSATKNKNITEAPSSPCPMRNAPAAAIVING